MAKKLGIILLIIFIFLAAILRFYKLGSVPQGLNVDEASYGYEAFTLMESGKDTWGNRLPFTLKSFGDYKPAALAYTIIPAVKLFDLNTLAVRLPSAVAGFLACLFMFLILQTFHKNSTLNLALMLVFAVSPWSFGISRLFYESNVSLLFFTAGFWLSLLYVKNKKEKCFYFSVFLIALSGLWYVAYRITGMIYLTLILLFGVFRDKKISIRHLKHFVVSLVVFLPLAFLTFNRAGLTRLKQESDGQKYSASLSINENRAMCYLSSGKNPFIGRVCAIWWNKPVQRLEHIGRSFLYQLGVNYLFLDQTQPDITPKNFGPYIWLLIPFYLLGFLLLSRKVSDFTKENEKYSFLAIAIFAGNLPAAFAGSPQFHRNTAGLFLAFVMIALGFHLLSVAKIGLLRRLIYLAVFTGVIFQTSQYLVYYFAVYTKQNHELWRYDSSELFSYIHAHESAYSEIWLEGFEDAPLYYSFYAKFDPREYQRTVRYSADREDGWTHAQEAGKVRSVSGGINKYLCRLSEMDKSANVMLVVPDNGDKFNASVFHTRDFTDIYTIHEVYDLRSLESAMKTAGWNPAQECLK